MTTPQIDLTPTRTICGRHGELFRDRWPGGYPAFATIAFDALNHDRTFAQLVGQLDQDTTLAIVRLLDARPVCCRLDPDTLLEVYRMVQKQAGCWDRRQCSLCGHRDHGAPYRKAPPTAKSKAPRGTWAHVCVRCVATADGQPPLRRSRRGVQL